ncbi:MAG: propionyl-CoA synthetase [Paraglaciecola sp.]
MFRAIAKEAPKAALMQAHGMSAPECLYLTGKRLDPATYRCLKDKTQRPVIYHWCQTETGWPIASIPLGTMGQATKSGYAGFSITGYKVEISDGQGKALAASHQGSAAIKLPLPPGCLSTLWQNLACFKAGYLTVKPGYYVIGDGGYIDDEGYLFVMGRTDDVINVAGHPPSTGKMAEILVYHPAVAECAVFVIHNELKGQKPLGLVVLKTGLAKHRKP